MVKELESPIIDRMSIMDSVKKFVNISPDDTSFDPDILICINSVFAGMTQMGIGPKEGIIVIDSTSHWDEYFDERYIGMVTNYVGSKTRMMFDPPASSAIIEAIKETIKETEFRLFIAVDNNELLSPNKEA